LILSSPNREIIWETSPFSKAGTSVSFFAGGAAAFAGGDDDGGGCEGVVESTGLFFGSWLIFI
jgi:hypothetical protein